MTIVEGAEMTAPARAQHTYAQLIDAIRAAQASDPCRRCTIVVPHHAVGLDVRRHLAEGGGAVNVCPMVLTELAHEVLDEAGALVGREPLTRTRLREEVSAELASAPRGFAEVADQPGTVEALVDASVALSRAASLPAPEDPGLAPITSDALAIHRAIQPRLAGTWTNHHLLGEAADLLAQDGPAREQLGAIVLFQLPLQHDPAAQRLAELLKAHAHAVITSGPLSPEETREAMDLVVSLTDPVEECRLAVESAAAALASGMPGHRIGIFFPAAEPYLGTVCALLEEAGIAFTAPGLAPASATPLARALLHLLDAEADAPDLRLVLDARWEGAIAAEVDGISVPPSARCERAFVAATGGTLEDTDDADGVEESLSTPSAPLTARDARDARLREDWRALRAVQATISRRLQAIDAATRWNDAVRAIGELLAVIATEVGTAAPHIAAVRTALKEIESRADLPSPGRSALARHLFAELARSRPRTGSLRTGVVVGAFNAAVARDLQLVHLLGLADGIAPAPATVDPILPDPVRARFGGVLRTAQQARADQERDLQQALVAGQRTIVTIPRGRMRESGPLLPSPLLQGRQPDVVLASPLAAARSGYPTSSPDRTPSPATTAGRAWQRALLWADGASDGDELPARAQQARRMRADRIIGRFTRFTGDVSAFGEELSVLSPHESEDPQPRGTSASALEKWAQEPYTYFVERVLGGELFEYPDEEDVINARDFGSLVHAALEDVVNEQLTTGAVPDPDRVAEIVAARGAEFTRDAWIPAQWAAEQRRAGAIVEGVAARLRTAADGYQPIAAESTFGLGEDAAYPAVSISLPRGVLHLRGKVDRVDRLHAGTADDGAIRVLDYKTGKPDKFNGIKTEPKDKRFNPTDGGKHLQLPIYSLHVRDHLARGDAAPRIVAVYEFIAEPSNPNPIPLKWGPEVEAAFREQIERITGAIADGLFPVVAAPKPWGSSRETWYTLVGQRDAERLTAALKTDPRVATALDIMEESDEH